MHVDPYTYIHAYIFIHRRMDMHILYRSIQKHTHIHVYRSIHTYIHVYRSIHTYMYIEPYIHTCI